MRTRQAIRLAVACRFSFTLPRSWHQGIKRCTSVTAQKGAQDGSYVATIENGPAFFKFIIVVTHKVEIGKRRSGNQSWNLEFLGRSSSSIWRERTCCRYFVGIEHQRRTYSECVLNWSTFLPKLTVRVVLGRVLYGHLTWIADYVDTKADGIRT